MISFPAEQRPFIIAEAGVNHNGDIGIAHTLIDIAADAGADAVKFQLFDPEELASSSAPLAGYQERSGESSQIAMLKRLTLESGHYVQLKEYAGKRNIEFITTPFDAVSAAFLASLGVRILKIPSGELTNIPFLERVAGLGLFTVISTGMATLDEVRDAVAPFQARGVPFALLHCVSAYPAPASQINLRAMQTLKNAFDVPVGYSDHTEGIEVSLMAAALGAEIIEKHFTLDRTMEGPDHAASLEPEELTSMIRRIRDADGLKIIRIPADILGDGFKRCQPSEENVRDVARRSIILSCDVQAGTVLTQEMLAIKRPGTGVAPKEFSRIPGRTAKKFLPSGTILTWEVLE